MIAKILQQPLVASIIFGLVITLLSFIDAKLNSIERSSSFYLRTFLIISVGTLAILYYTNGKDFKKIISLSGGGGGGGGVDYHGHGHGHHHHRSVYPSNGGGSRGNVELPDF